MKFKKMAALLLVTTFLASATACSSKAPAETPATPAAPADKIVEIDFFHRWPNEPRKSYYAKKIAEFEALHKNVKINVDQVLNDAYKEKIRVLISSDSLPDIFTSWSDSFAENLVSSGRIMPLNDIYAGDKAWSDKIMASQIGSFTFDDKVYGVPFTIDGKAFFYNKKIFAENNLKVPATFEEFVAALETLKKAGYETALVEGLTDAWAVSHYIGSIFQRVMDPAVTAKDYNVKTGEFTDPGYVKGLEAFKTLTTYMGETSTAIDHETARNMFGNGEVPVIYLQFAEIKLIEDIGGAEFGYFNFPAFADGKGDQKALTGAPEGFMLSKNAPPEAVEFLKFLTSVENATEFTKTDGQLNAIEGGVTDDNTSAARKEAYDLILGASKSAPWFDNAVNINIGDIFMRGGQSLAIDQTTPEDIMKEVQNEAARLRK
jgi:raffinose/stachyose/melibiose transport system substrate-binding protein